MNLEASSVIMSMPEETKNINFTEALNMLETISNDSFVIDVLIPSLGRNIKVKELTARQQKSLIESAVDVSVNNLTFSKYFYKIITENCLEDKSILENFNLADIISIAINLRLQISDTIKVVFQEDPKIEDRIEIKSILDKISSYVTPDNKFIEYSKNGVFIKIETGLPTYSTMYEYDDFLYGDRNKKSNIEDIKNILSTAFLGETSKYIKEIYINDENKGIGYGAMTIAQKQQIIGSLPASLLQSVLEEIVSRKEIIDDICKFEKEGIKKNIEIDSLLFLTV